MMKVDSEQVIDMMNIMHKVRFSQENAPSTVAPHVVAALEDFMQRLTLADCESFARDVRRVMDNIIEIKSS